MLIVAGTGYVDPDHRAALLEGLVPSLRRVRTAPGCLEYVVAADPIEPDRVNIYERWESQTHLDAHLADVAQTAPPMPGVRSVEVMRYEISGVSPLQS
ncbi:antibiotic biosynthesis monooxygenase [Planobispora rosea]|uniref:Antibiotic biosynthesis monooxygenase n=1 Tax=Planobispora rosea TaxID=35762 RepID=A0A8J3SA12_PLARO|nr:antibiotic biosynthesis monooxygenase [Planobispora rosea]GGT03689.1 antibiotic biosynthesis monooxygenase [Planobispora rosea]GIH88761.1 antibiotic biosynthesis monooxygenase [Planobispora rosea]